MPQTKTVSSNKFPVPDKEDRNFRLGSSSGFVDITYTVDDDGVVRGADVGENATFVYWEPITESKVRWNAGIDEIRASSVQAQYDKLPSDDRKIVGSIRYQKVAIYDSDGTLSATAHATTSQRNQINDWNTGNRANNKFNTLIQAAQNTVNEEENIAPGSVRNQTGFSTNVADDDANSVIDGVLTALPEVDLDIPSKNVRSSYQTLYYPQAIATNKQDRIVFTMRQSEGSTITTDILNSAIKRKTTDKGKITGSVTLPIQSGIVDRNSVDWNPGQLNPISAAAVGASLQLAESRNITELAENVSAISGRILNQLKTSANKGVADATKLYIAQQAVGTQGLLSRATGAIVNPNLELLFNSPQLRPFSFTFKMTPRDATEATQVRQIIRFFKQGMSVKTSETSIFLKAPNIFDIAYKTFDNSGNQIAHPSINRIKTCALVSCDVDYTPDGTYMTYNDARRTLTSYRMTLNFNELDPVYEDDYNETVDLTKNPDFDPFSPDNLNPPKQLQDDEIGF